MPDNPVRGRFLHFGFTWSSPPKTTSLEPIFDSALDWIRYSPNCWILWTTTDVNAWNMRLKPHLKAQDMVIIAEINFAEAGKTFTGMQEKWVWEWVQKKR